MWLNLYDHEDVRRKLKNSLKTHTKKHFLPTFELTSDSLTTLQVEPFQCPSHHLILLIQGQISEIFTKFVREFMILKISVLLSWPFWNFFSNNFFLLYSHENQSKVLGYQGWVKILMIIALFFCPKTTTAYKYATQFT